MSHRRIRFGGPKRTRSTTTELPEQIEITSLSLEGRGIARNEGKLIFVTGALPGEIVSASLEKSNKRFDEAKTVDVIKPAACRVEPSCKFYENCGGCDLQHLDSDTAVTLKTEQILSTLERQTGIKPEQVDPALKSSSTLGYRRSARVGINQRDNGELIIGFRRSASNKLVDIDKCIVLTERMNAFLSKLRESLAPFEKLKHLTHIELVDGDNGLCVEIRATKRPSDELMAALTHLSQSEEAYLRIALEKETLELNKPFDPSYKVSGHNIELGFDTSDFLQVNAAINEQLIDKAIDWLAPKESDQVLDLFSGLGNFTLPLAQRTRQVTAVEGSDKMVERCMANADHNKLSNIQAFKADLSKLDINSSWLQQDYDLIVLDPPRQGAADVIPKLKEQSARSILYIACDPMSLVRDAQLLTELGYKMTRFAVADMFPQTHHIESLALFEAAK